MDELTWRRVLKKWQREIPENPAEALEQARREMAWTGGRGAAPPPRSSGEAGEPDSAVEVDPRQLPLFDPDPECA